MWQDTEAGKSNVCTLYRSFVAQGPQNILYSYELHVFSGVWCIVGSCIAYLYTIPIVCKWHSFDTSSFIMLNIYCEAMSFGPIRNPMNFTFFAHLKISTYVFLFLPTKSGKGHRNGERLPVRPSIRPKNWSKFGLLVAKKWKRMKLVISDRY